MRIQNQKFLNINILGEMSDNWPNDLLANNVYKTLKPC